MTLSYPTTIISIRNRNAESSRSPVGRIILTRALSRVTCVTPGLEAFHLQYADQELQIRHHSVSRNASSLGDGRQVWGA
jgi:hypothetical protein